MSWGSMIDHTLANPREGLLMQMDGLDRGIKALPACWIVGYDGQCGDGGGLYNACTTAKG
jgi:hypothetical protein